MLIGRNPKKPNIEKVRYIKNELRHALQIPEDAIITVAELTCLEEGCAPVETVIGLLRPKMNQVQHRLHKDIQSLNPDDLVQVCSAWGFDIPKIHFKQFSTSKNTYRS